MGENKKFKFDVIIGNPPYQMSDGGNNASSIPLYDKFIDGAKKINPEIMCLIIPNRWYAGGRGLDNFRQTMMNDSHLVELHDYINADECFPGMDISGGICFFIRDLNHNGKCKVIDEGSNMTSGIDYRYLNEFPIIIGDNRAVSILRKIVVKNEITLNSKVSTQRPFGLRTYARPTGQGNITLRWNGGTGLIEKEAVTAGTEIIDKWKVIVSRVFYEHAGKADKNGQNRVLSILDILPPDSVCTETYIVIDSFKSEAEAINLKKYLQSKFARFLVLQASSSIMITKNSFVFVPIQNYTFNSDIDWSQSIPDIDKQLYKKYGLSLDEIDFIESHVKEMA